MVGLKVNILGVDTTAQTFNDAAQTIIGWVARREKRYICTCTVYTVMRATEDAYTMDALQNADMVTADGMPLVWLQKRWGDPQAERVYGPDLMLEVCKQSAEIGARHYFFGGKPHVVETLSRELTTRFPKLQIVGSVSPMVTGTPIPVDAELVEGINATAPNIIWVGLGSPKQDQWMYAYRDAFPNSTLIAVGAAFDFLSGTIPQAPRWMQRSGTEWLFRLLQEPGRLWKRYLWYNPRFILAVLRQAMRREK